MRHRALGFDANAMAVFDVADAAAAAKFLCASPAVTLCYERPRREPDWRHNLFAMIHGRDRTEVEQQIAALAQTHAPGVVYEILFSRRCFRQRGARLSAA